ncbi:DUF3813 domain-containing protein [Bacillus massilinigeriensis]|uniref:DUF3813 domain-containing protein n=1 Tax=Bacillus massilionigeriensis TaxID=1805475 RepID=UPI00096AEB77|nr:DUF3813 domain-containing protein [Bacillus massilionigeriensis]
MTNRLLREAKVAVGLAKTADPSEQYAAIETAKNALSSAYANTSMAEKEQLQQLQNELDQL